MGLFLYIGLGFYNR